jgi:hypothetical protein
VLWPIRAVTLLSNTYSYTIKWHKSQCFIELIRNICGFMKVILGDTKTPFAAVRPSRFKGAKYIGAN